MGEKNIQEQLLSDIAKAYPNYACVTFPYSDPVTWADEIHSFNKFWNDNKLTLLQNIKTEPSAPQLVKYYGIYQFFDLIPRYDITELPGRTHAEINLMLFENLIKLNSYIISTSSSNFGSFNLNNSAKIIAEGFSGIEIIKLFESFYSKTFLSRCFNFLIPFWIESKYQLYTEFFNNEVLPNLGIIETPIFTRDMSKLTFPIVPISTLEKFPDERFKNYEAQFWKIVFSSISEYPTGNKLKIRKLKIIEYYRFAKDYSSFIEPKSQSVCKIPNGQGRKVIEYLVDDRASGDEYVTAEALKTKLDLRDLSQVFKNHPIARDTLLDRDSNGQRVRLNIPISVLTTSD